MPTPLRNVRVHDQTWNAAHEALQGLTEPRRVSVTIRPGMNRTSAVVAFLRAVARC